MSFNKILFLLEEAAKIKNQISEEISKERDAKRKKKLWKAANKALKTHDPKHVARIRALLYKR